MSKHEIAVLNIELVILSRSLSLATGLASLVCSLITLCRRDARYNLEEGWTDRRVTSGCNTEVSNILRNLLLRPRTTEREQGKVLKGSFSAMP